MNDKEILAASGECNTHVECSETFTFLQSSGYGWHSDSENYFDQSEVGALPLNDFANIRKISDIQRIIELEDENAELKRRLEALQPKPTCVNCEEPEVIDNLCGCCGWLQKEGKYEVKS